MWNWPRRYHLFLYFSSHVRHYHKDLVLSTHTCIEAALSYQLKNKQTTSCRPDDVFWRETFEHLGFTKSRWYFKTTSIWYLKTFSQVHPHFSRSWKKTSTDSPCDTPPYNALRIFERALWQDAQAQGGGTRAVDGGIDIQTISSANGQIVRGGTSTRDQVIRLSVEWVCDILFVERKRLPRVDILVRAMPCELQGLKQ